MIKKTCYIWHTYSAIYKVKQENIYFIKFNKHNIDSRQYSSVITGNESINENLKISKSVYFCVLCCLPVAVISAQNP
jgi:hypothetical protein